MRDIVVWGATGHARVLREALAGTDFRIIAFFDSRVLPSPVADVPLWHGRTGFSEWLSKHTVSASSTVFFAVAIGGANGRARIEIGDWLCAQGLSPVTIVHRASWTAADAVIGTGCHVLAGALIATQVRLGRSVIVNTGASVDHGCAIRDGVHIGPGAVLAGEVAVESCAFIGAGATILPKRRIGADAIVGAGSVVTRDVPPGVVVAGNPARPIIRNS